VGVHWPLDILAGAFGGWLSGVMGCALATRYPWGTSQRGEKILALIFIGIALYLALRSDPVYAQTQVFQIVLAVVCLGLGGWGLWKRRNK